MSRHLSSSYATKTAARVGKGAIDNPGAFRGVEKAVIDGMIERNQADGVDEDISRFEALGSIDTGN